MFRLSQPLKRDHVEATGHDTMGCPGVASGRSPIDMYTCDHRIQTFLYDTPLVVLFASHTPPAGMEVGGRIGAPPEPSGDRPNVSWQSGFHTASRAAARANDLLTRLHVLRSSNGSTNRNST